MVSGWNNTYYLFPAHRGAVESFSTRGHREGIGLDPPRRGIFVDPGAAQVRASGLGGPRPSWSSVLVSSVSGLWRCYGAARANKTVVLGQDFVREGVRAELKSLEFETKRGTSYWV